MNIFHHIFVRIRQLKHARSMAHALAFLGLALLVYAKPARAWTFFIPPTLNGVQIDWYLMEKPSLAQASSAPVAFACDRALDFTNLGNITRQEAEVWNKGIQLINQYNQEATLSSSRGHPIAAERDQLSGLIAEYDMHLAAGNYWRAYACYYFRHKDAQNANASLGQSVAELNYAYNVIAPAAKSIGRETGTQVVLP